MQLMGSDPFQTVTILTSVWKRYHAKLFLLNRTNSLVFVRDINLSAGEGKIYEPADDVTDTRLEPHQSKKISIVFRVPDKDTPAEEGNFKLKVIPTSGRKTIVKGRLHR